MTALRFDLAAHDLRTSVFGLMSNISENWRSNFLALCYFTRIYGPYEIGLLSVNTYGVDTVVASIIALC